MECNGKTDIHNGMEWDGKADINNYFPWNRSNGTERPKVVFGIKQYSLLFLNLKLYQPNFFLWNGTEWKGMEKLIYIFGIKTMFTGICQSLA